MSSATEKVKAVAFNDDDGQIWVEVEGPDVESVRSTAAKQCAIKAAASQGYSRCGFNQDTGPFIVDEEGNAIETEDDGERMAKESELITKGKARYRNRIRVMQGVGL